MENASLDYNLILENCGVGSKPLQVVLENLSHLEEFYSKEERIDIYDYCKAYESLRFSTDGKTVFNPTCYEVFFCNSRDGNKVYSVKPGEALHI